MKVPEKLGLMAHIITAAFAGQMRISSRGGPKIPSWTHSMRLMLLLQSYGYPPEVFLGGGSHDLDEDTDITARFIRINFNERVEFLMSATTLDPELGDTPEGEEELFERVIKFAEEGDLDPLRIKVCDSFDNNRNIHQLDAAWAPDMLKRGFRWLEAAKRFIPDEAMVEDFEVLLNREKRLMAA